MVGDRFAIGVEQLAALAAPRVGQSHARGIAGQIDQRDACGGHFVIVGIALGVLADVAALQNHGPQAQGVQPAADFETVGTGFQHEEILRCELRRANPARGPAKTISERWLSTLIKVPCETW